ncbi:MAG: hypothetical protein QOF68_1440 [Gaiellales bacterium]|jgi:uncharacterized membrane protein YgcG|nr:hypothetical protein [Gaiellales bacterium]
MRRWVVIAVVVLIALLAAVAAGGWWFVNDRVRISEGDLVSEVKDKKDANEVVCVKQDSRAEYWLCAVVDPKPDCVRVHVRPWGAVEMKEGFRQCLDAAGLEGLIPATSGGGTSGGGGSSGAGNSQGGGSSG